MAETCDGWRCPGCSTHFAGPVTRISPRSTTRILVVTDSCPACRWTQSYQLPLASEAVPGAGPFSRLAAEGLGFGAV